MGYLDNATRWSLGLWLVFGFAPVVMCQLPWSTWLKDEKLAAWVQAFGSIAAILAAVWIAGRQSRQALQMKRDEAADAIEVRAQVAHAGVAAIRNLLAIGRHKGITPHVTVDLGGADPRTGLLQMANSRFDALEDFPITAFRNSQEVEFAEYIRAHRGRFVQLSSYYVSAFGGTLEQELVDLLGAFESIVAGWKGLAAKARRE